MALPWKDERHITHRSFRLIDLVEEEPVIMGKTFEDCTIYGPAVLLPVERTIMEHNSFNGTSEGIFWEIPDDRNYIIGAVGLVDCTFRRCNFHGIGISGKRPLLEQFLRAFDGSLPAPDPHTTGKSDDV